MNNNVDSMLEAVSSKLGITPQRLKEAMQKGDISIALEKCLKRRKKLKSILGNPELIKKMMKSAQAQELKNL
ncbi:MAG: hypothetical protein ACLS48_03125 [[Eubacterium] siraeum]